MTATTVLENVGVKVRNTTLVDDVSFELPKGGFITLLGVNGSGKTTVLRALAGAVRYSGRIEIEGRDVAHTSTRDLARLRSFAQQESELPSDTTVRQFVSLGRAPYERLFSRTGSDDETIVESSLEQCEIRHLATRKVSSLSGGERRRSVLAQTLAQRTPLVLLDEPTSALDIGQQQRFLELVDRIRLEQGITFLVALHDLTVAAQFSTSVVLLESGRILRNGPPAEVMQRTTLQEHYGTRLWQIDHEHGSFFTPRRDT